MTLPNQPRATLATCSPPKSAPHAGFIPVIVWFS